MKKEKYEKPVMEIVELKDDVILDSTEYPCPPVGVCYDSCQVDLYCPAHVSACDSIYTQDKILNASNFHGNC